MGRFDEVLGHEVPRELLGRLLDSNRIPQAILFQGPEGVGKATLARAFAAALLCSEQNGQACGKCDDCRMQRTGCHLDFLLIQRLPQEKRPKELRKFIAVNQIRDLSHLAGLSPRRELRRIFLIDPADRMNTEAQNALLKTLEEPASRTVLILIASRPHLLLPTVRSRCLALRFAPLKTPVLASLLERLGMAKAEAHTRASLSQGRAGAAIDLDLDRLREKRTAILEALEFLSRGSAAAAELPAMAAALAGRDEPTLLESLALLQELLRDAARATVDPEDLTLVHSDLRERLAALGRRLGEVRSARLSEAVDELRGGLRFNLNRTLVVESLLAAAAGGPIPRGR